MTRVTRATAQNGAGKPPHVQTARPVTPPPSTRRPGARSATVKGAEHDKFMLIARGLQAGDEPVADPLFTLGAPAHKRVTSNIMTKYELANAIGTRALHIGRNYPIYVDVTGMDDDVAMARKELYAGKCPLIVRRFLPGHTADAPHYEDWPVSELLLRAK